ncbi:hypothetical protein GCM10029964_030700 [Kibdelosporangium lantanae]
MATTTPTRPRTWIWISALVIFVAGVTVGYAWLVGAVLGTDSCPSPSEAGPRYPLCDQDVFGRVALTPFVGVIAALVVLGGGALATLRGWRARWWIWVAWTLWVASLVTAWVMGRHVMA